MLQQSAKQAWPLVECGALRNDAAYKRSNVCTKEGTQEDLRDVRLTGRDAVKFLSVTAGGMKLENCPAYVREWMDREKD